MKRRITPKPNTTQPKANHQQRQQQQQHFMARGKNPPSIQARIQASDFPSPVTIHLHIQASPPVSSRHSVPDNPEKLLESSYALIPCRSANSPTREPIDKCQFSAAIRNSRTIWRGNSWNVICACAGCCFGMMIRLYEYGTRDATAWIVA